MEINIAQLLTVLGVILVSMTLHELMHGLVAFKLGDHTARHEGRLTLNPLKHIDPFLTIILPLLLTLMNLPAFGGAKPVPINPYALKGGDFGMALVGIAGPLTNFVLALISFGALVLFGAAAPPLASVLTTSVVVNLGFFVFNMIPIPPLDGSRVLYALAPDVVQHAMEKVERQGLLIVFVVMMLASQYISAFVGAGVQAILVSFANLFGAHI